MEKLLKKIYTTLESLKYFIPEPIKLRLNPEKYSIIQFMDFASNKIKNDELILDAGAGRTPYKKYFQHAKYESCDFEDIFHKESKKLHSFVCDLEDIPKEKETYDSILCTQVLEHVEHPSKVLNEFNRILKKNGKLFLTVPQGWGLHGEPYHFFNFTSYGLKLLFKENGYKIKFIKEKGGYFWYLSDRINRLPNYLLIQYFFKKKKNRHLKFQPSLIGFLYVPFYILLIPFTSFIIPMLFFYLDKLDKEKKFTLGYVCYVVKNEKI